MNKRVDARNCVLGRIVYWDISTTKNKYYYERYYIVETDRMDITSKNLTVDETKKIK